MNAFIFTLCLLTQEAESSGSKTQKAVPSHAGDQREDSFRKEDLDTLQRKVESLEAALNELKQRPAASTEKSKTPESQNETPKTANQEDEEKRKKLEEEFKKALGAPENNPNSQQKSQSSPYPPAGGSIGSSFRLIDMAFDILAVGGTSTASEAEMRDLEAGGHDPKNRGFTVQNVELTFAGVVDPYLRGDANIVLQIDQNGDTTIELEEAYLTTLEFPYNLQLKAGQYFSQFGRLNAMHPHTWDFVDQPVVNSRLLGEDGFRGPGGQLSWLTPLPFFAELTGSVQNSQGGTAKSFRDVPGDVVAGRTIIGRPVRTLGDLAYVIRLKTSFDPADEITIVPGISALFGPNASALDTRTGVYGVDFYAKWKPLANDQGWPFVAWQTEAMRRNYQAGAVFDTAGALLAGAKTLEDWGAYSQIVWGFSRPWTLGLRFDYANGQRDSYPAGAGVAAYDSIDDPFRDRRERATIDLTYYPSEFSKVRIQYNYDHSPFLSNISGDAHSIYLQFEILFGAHGAHKF